MANEFWMSDRQWAVLEPLIPMNRRGVKPKRNREVIPTAESPDSRGGGNILSYQRHARSAKSRYFRPLVLSVALSTF